MKEPFFTFQNNTFVNQVDLFQLSCNGFTVTGNRASIEWVREMHHDIIPKLEERVKELEVKLVYDSPAEQRNLRELKARIDGMLDK